MRVKHNQFSTVEMLFFLLGFFSSIAIVKVNLGFIQLTPYNFILYIIAFRTLFYAIKNKCLLRKDYNFITILICFVISCIVNLNLPSAWINANLTMTINYLILGVVLLLNGEVFFSKNKASFIKGLWINSWIQLIWGTLQFFMYRLNGQSLNQLLFQEILHIEGSNYTMSYLGLQRITGLHWECAYYALALTIGMILASRRWQQLLFFAGILLSTSRTGILTAVVAIFVMIIINLKKSKIKKKVALNYKSIVIYGIFLCTLVIVGYRYGSLIFSNIADNLLRFQNLSTDSSALV